MENIVYALGLMNIYKMDPLAFPRDLSTVVANDVSKLSMITAYGGSFNFFYLMFPGRTNFSEGLNPGPATVDMY